MTDLHRIGEVRNFANMVKGTQGRITKCLCHQKVLMFFLTPDATMVVSDDRSQWPWEEAPKEWADLFERS